ncbi:MAG: fasciclin domain-containing protein [Gemmatimonadales bacterium]
MGFTRQAALRLWWLVVPFAVPHLAAQEMGDTARAAREVGGPDLMPRDTAPDPDTSFAPTAPADTAQGAAAASDTAARDTATTRYTMPRDTIGADSIPVDDFPVDSVPADTIAVGQVRTESEEDDTSLTARMDVRRGGGLKRSEFPDLRETAALTGYRTFLRLLERSRVGEEMRPESSYTLLAPSDSAFARVPPAALERLESDSAALAAWMKALVLEGSFTGDDLLERGEATSLGGQTIEFSRDSAGALLVDDAVVAQPDLLARDGVLQGLDRVTLPDAATSASP